MKVILAGGARLQLSADEFRLEGAEVLAVVVAAEPARAVRMGDADASSAALLQALSRTDALVVDASRESLTRSLVETCDRLGVRLVARCERPAERRLAERFGVHAVPATAPAADVLAPSSSPREGRQRTGRVIVVWGPAGAPGRSTIALALAQELARDGRRVAVADADSHAPSLALRCGLPDEGPGFAAACRQAERGALSVAELERIALPADELAVLTGINRPSRWPELGAERIRQVFDVAREWADDTIVDVSSSLEADEEIVSDLFGGPRRNAATLGALRAADLVVAVAAADPVGVSRFVRSFAELRAVIGSTPVRVLVNKTRSSVLGLDPRGQVVRTMERYLGVRDVWFAPFDPRATDAALLQAQPLLRVAGRSALTASVRRFVGEALESSRARGPAGLMGSVGPVGKRCRRSPRAVPGARGSGDGR